MGKLSIINSVLNVQYEYKNEALKIAGNYNQDAETKTVKSINGSIFRLGETQETYIGNFSGADRDGEMRYSFSEIASKDADAILEAVGEIEQYIIAADEEESAA